MGPWLTGDLANQALTMPILHRALKAGLLHHSRHDRQHACVESFLGMLKRELLYHRQYRTHEDAAQDIFEYIEAFYNRLRRHSALGHYSLAEFEARIAVA